MNSKVKCAIAAGLVGGALVGLFTMPTKSYASDEYVIENVKEKDAEVVEYGPIVPVQVFPPITPKPIIIFEEVTTDEISSGNDSGREEEYSGDESNTGERGETIQDFDGTCEYVQGDNGESAGSITEGDFDISGAGSDAGSGEVYDTRQDDIGESIESNVEVAENPVEPALEYLGEWTITAYCGCAECCGSWGNATASGEPPISGHTVACNSLPFYTQVMIDGVTYTVEDTGSTPYGDAWIDIYFDTHEEALAYGEHVTSVYIVR